MPTFRFNAVDSAGMLRDGTIDAPDGLEARSRLEGNGLKVRELEEVASAAGDESLSFPRASSRAAENGSRGAPVRSGSSRAGLLFGLAGFLLALATASYVVYRDPPWGRLSKYNFSTPEQALKSELRMEANADLLARIEFLKKLDKKQIKEKLNSLEVKDTGEFKGKTVLFIVYKTTDKETKKEKEQKEVVWYEKDEESGLWMSSYVSEFEIREKDKELAKKIKAWTNRGAPEMPDMPN